MSEKSDIDAEKARLLRRDAEWVLAASEGRDIERILSFWTDDAVVLPPDLPAIIGKVALRQYVESSLQIPGFRITWSTDETVLSSDGQFAYLLGNNAVTMDDPAGEPVTTNDVRSRSGNEEPTGNGAAPWTSGMRSQPLADAMTSSQHVYEVRPRKGLTPNDITPVHAVSRKDIGCAPLKPQR